MSLSGYIRQRQTENVQPIGLDKAMFDIAIDFGALELPSSKRYEPGSYQ